ncbi:hypothetical protein BGX26_007414 [Mortierella sp. AD094]|nr:hypothetical protein BGX26_007414 [Mortierella sp. AD094]
MQRPTLSIHQSTNLPRLVVTDLDGTLLNPQHTVSRRSIDALSHAQQYHLSSVSNDSLGSAVATNDSLSRHRHPIQIMIASGRSPRSIQKVIDLFEGLMIPDAVICCNGALNYNPRTKVISYPQFIPLDHTLFMVEQLRSEILNYGTRKSQVCPPSKNKDSQEAGHDDDLKPLSVHNNTDDDQLMAGRPGFSCEVIWITGTTPSGEPIYGQDTSFVCDRTWELQRKHTIYYEYTVVEGTMEEFVKSLQNADAVEGVGRRGGIIKLMALDRNRSAPDVFYSLPESLRPASSSTTSSVGAVSAEQGSPDGTSPRVSITYSGNYFLEISAAGVNKGLGLAKYCEAHQIPREEVVAFGDLLNDAEMLQFAGLGLCMGNGHEEMKKSADRVIGTNAEDGVAKEIESWFTS